MAVPCPPGSYSDLSEHVSSLVTLVGLFATVIAVLFWRMLTRMENKIDEIQDLHSLCKDEFVSQKDFEIWQVGRGPLWDRINHHGHDRNGKVIIEEK